MGSAVSAAVFSTTLLMVTVNDGSQTAGLRLFLAFGADLIVL